MIALRTSEGIDLGSLTDDEVTNILKKSKRYIDTLLLKQGNNHLVLTREGKLLADGIAADLFC